MHHHVQHSLCQLCPSALALDEMSHWLFKVPRAWVSLQSLVLMVGSTQGSSQGCPSIMALAGSACEVRQLQLDWRSVTLLPSLCWAAGGSLPSFCLYLPTGMCLQVCLVTVCHADES